LIRSGLRSQFATLKIGRGSHRKYLPYVFTEQGIAMLSSVLNSEHAVQVNIAIMRAFVQMRELVASNRDLANKSPSWSSGWGSMMTRFAPSSTLFGK
jgi:hypothetical protein